MTWTRSPQPTREQRIAERAERNAAQAQTCMPRRAAVMGGATSGPVPAARQKVPGKVRQSIRDSARGEQCQVRLPGICTGDPETTIWSHYPGLSGGRGMGTKSIDLAGCYCCNKCHDVVDERVKLPAGMTRQDVLLAWHEAHIRSLVCLVQKGLL